MNAFVGPICRNCLTECRRDYYTADTGYVHGVWVHVVDDDECERVDVEWVPLEEYERIVK